MYYKNVSISVKTFHGVTFNPGEIKEVNEYINHNLMIPVDKPEVANTSTEEASQQITKQQKPSSDKPKKSEEKKGSSSVGEAITENLISNV